MDSRDQFEANGRDVVGYKPEASTGEYPATIMQVRSNSFTGEGTSRFSDKKGLTGSNWGGNIMWTFAFGEKETSEMAESVLSSGKQAWHLLSQMNDLCKTRHGETLRSPALILQLTSELRAIATDCMDAWFALELRVIKKAGGLPDLELMDNGAWRKPSLRMSAYSHQGMAMTEMGD